MFTKMTPHFVVTCVIQHENSWGGALPSRTRRLCPSQRSLSFEWFGKEKKGGDAARPGHAEIDDGQVESHAGVVHAPRPSVDAEDGGQGQGRGWHAEEPGLRLGFGEGGETPRKKKSSIFGMAKLIRKAGVSFASRHRRRRLVFRWWRLVIGSPLAVHESRRLVVVVGDSVAAHRHWQPICHHISCGPTA